MNYLNQPQEVLEKEKKKVETEYNELKKLDLSLDMSRGKPSSEQTDLSNGMFDVLNSNSNFFTVSGVDCRNYGLLDGIPRIKNLFSQLLQVSPENIFVGGNSSLNMMFDVFTMLMTHGIGGCKPWFGQGVKFLCPVPGYDRHFAITEYYGVEMINIPMTASGPDMDLIEELVAKDDKIKGIWCVPKYSNPQGITYSDETVIRFSKLKPKAKDFRIIWDNAYCIHDLKDKSDNLLNIMKECEKNGNEDLPLIFCSTSKITFPGSGVAAMAASEANMKEIKKRYSIQTIGYDKLNQLKHIKFFNDYDGLINHMEKHKAILKPKFDLVVNTLKTELSDKNIADWNDPNGGYFVSVNVLPGCAKRVVKLCEDAGLKLTPAGATYPKYIDVKDSNIRLAPTYPPLNELKLAIKIFSISVKLAALEKLIK